MKRAVLFLICSSIALHAQNSTQGNWRLSRRSARVHGPIAGRRCQELQESRFTGQRINRVRTTTTSPRN